MTKPVDPRARFAKDAWIRALQRMTSIEQNPRVTLPVLIEHLAERHEAASALESSQDSLTYRELAQRCNQYARWGLMQGLQPGDSVSLIMSNCAEYLAVWLGLSRIGVAVALVNHQLTGALLVHAIETVAPKLVIVGAEQAGAIAAARDSLPGDLAYWVRGAASEDLAPIEPTLFQQLADSITSSQCALPSMDANALYIYTSGTTGHPKAAKVSHRRVMQWSQWFAGLLDTTSEDRMYDCLPLYHSVGGVVATGATLIGGGAVVIRNRFSATQFWQDIRNERCTLFQYIGELCRYLLNAPHDPAERAHSLRIACGNGLRGEIWRAFEERFRIPRILEYYAATEGAFSLYNCEGEPGAVGRIPPYLRNQLQVQLVRFDVQSGEPWRHADGFCRRCAVDEVGEAVGKGRFEGYADATVSETKILRDVFAVGDAWYRTGDLMRCDDRGFYYFVDRVGDTYRWKGENVSTTEVMSVLATVPGVLDALVYGVLVPGTDGRAGMAALIVNPAFDVGLFREIITQRLPRYSRPLFLRLLPRFETTGTFKPLKRDLVRTAFDPALVSDPMYVDSAAASAYVPMNHTVYAAILAGDLRL